MPQDRTEIFRSRLIFFDDGLPDTTCTPMEELARAYRRIFSRKVRWQIMNIASELGDEKFRETISKMLNSNRGMQTSVSELCITRGSQMALYLTAHCLLGKGDNILIENLVIDLHGKHSEVPVQLLYRFLLVRMVLT